MRNHICVNSSKLICRPLQIWNLSYPKRSEFRSLEFYVPKSYFEYLSYVNASLLIYNLLGQSHVSNSSLNQNFHVMLFSWKKKYRSRGKRLITIFKINTNLTKSASIERLLEFWTKKFFVANVLHDLTNSRTWSLFFQSEVWWQLRSAWRMNKLLTSKVSKNDFLFLVALQCLGTFMAHRSPKWPRV